MEQRHKGYDQPYERYHGGMPAYGPPPYHDYHVNHALIPVVDHHSGYSPLQPHPQMSLGGYQGPMTPFAPGPAQAGKRRPLRAQQACEQCRQRKQKCDEGRPCTFCKEQGIDCTYRDTPHAKADKNQEKVMSVLEDILTQIKQTNERAELVETRLAKLEDHNVEEKTPVVSVAGINNKEAFRSSIRGHRTGPHKLISLWPSIPPLFAPGEKPPDDYVISAEDRGVLRLYGRGEGIDAGDGTQPGTGGGPPSEDGSELNGFINRDGLWGRGLGALVHNNAVSPKSTVAGFMSDGSLDLSSKTILDLYDNFLEHMHRMHPFLDRLKTKKLVEEFISKYSPDQRGGTLYAGPSPVLSISIEVDRPTKRARTSDGLTDDDIATSADSRQTALLTERSPANAIVWLILALGKICQHSDPLPAIARDDRAPTNHVILSQLTGKQSLHDSPLSDYTTASSRSTPAGHVTLPGSNMQRLALARSRTPSQGSGSTIPARNLDVIPGLAYFAKAAEIIGDQSDGTDLVHAQMFLLAALYKGQLARVKESMRWLVKAGSVCQMLIDRNGLYKPEMLDTVRSWRDLPADQQESVWEKISAKTAVKRNKLILLASWSALQLESDILAEVKYPHSGINAIEDILIVHQACRWTKMPTIA